VEFSKNLANLSFKQQKTITNIKFNINKLFEQLELKADFLLSNK
jgi:hypothetical protein